MVTRIGVVLLAAMCHAATGLAQQPGAATTLRGQVVDAQGAGVQAEVRITEVATGRQRTTRTESDGHFTVDGLTPGVVDVVLAAAGFAERAVSGVQLDVGRTAVLDVRLDVARQQETVTVTGDAGRVDILRTGVGAVISAGDIESLPLNGRNFLELALLTPGNGPAPNFDPTKSQAVIVSSAGQAGRGGNITVDGMDANDDVVGGPLLNIPQDAVQEFQVATSRFDAAAGRSAGSVINVVTRSGSDTPSGSVAAFFRDDAWQARPPLADPAAGLDPPFDRQQVSFTAGGPLQRQRLFAFGAFELRNQDGGVLTGSRDTTTRTIRRSYVGAPLDDRLATLRVDWHARSGSVVTARYTGQREDAVGASTLERPIGTASQRQRSITSTQALFGSWSAVLSPTALNAVSVSISDFDNGITPLEPGRQLTFPSLQAGSSFRVPQGTRQRRWQVGNEVSVSRGTHQVKAGGQLQRVDAHFDLGVFRDGRVELVEDFPAFDRNGDGAVNDDDLLFAVTLRSGHPDQDLVIPDADNVHVAAYLQDEWRVHPRLTLNLGVRYELDTDVNNVSRAGELNPLVAEFAGGPRRRDTNNWAPRVGVNWAANDGRTSLRGGYGIYYDRVTLQIQSLERGLDGRALPIEVRAGNTFFVDQSSGGIPPVAPTVSNPFGGFILPGAGASGINIIDARLQNPKVHQLSVGVEQQFGAQVVRLDLLRNHGTDFIIGRTVGSVFNPVVGGPDRVVRLESSAETDYTGLLVEVERRYAGRFGGRLAYTLASARNYANDDQIPFGSGPLDSNDLRREYGPAANDRRHRLVLSGVTEIAAGIRLAGIWTIASGVPMDILMPSGQSRVPSLSRNAGGREFTSARELNAFIDRTNAAGGIDGELLPRVADDARLSDSFTSLDLRVSRTFTAGALQIEAMAELFNVFNVTNVLGTSTLNYSGFVNTLARDANDPADPGYLRSSTFGTPVSTAGGVLGSGGPFALQLGARVRF